MTRKIRPIIRGNIVVWPRRPIIRPGVNLARQRTTFWHGSNIVPFPGRITATSWMDDIRLNNIEVIRATVRAMRPDQRNTYALKKLRKMFLHPA